MTERKYCLKAKLHISQDNNGRKLNTAFHCIIEPIFLHVNIYTKIILKPDILHVNIYTKYKMYCGTSSSTYKLADNIHEKISQFGLAESSAVLKKYSAKKGNTVQCLKF